MKRSATHCILGVLFTACAFACGDDTPSDGGLDASDTADAMGGADVDAMPPPSGLDVVFLMREGLDERRLRDRVVTHVRATFGRWLESVPEIRVAVLGTDMGWRDAENRVCSELGSEGRFRGGTDSVRCAAPQRFVDSAVDSAPEQLACLLGDVAMMCTAEQPLEAALAATSTASESYRFFGNSRDDGVVGLGDTINAGFRRPEYPLLLIVPTLEDDCSFIPRNFFADLVENFRVRCAERSDDLYSPESYAEALATLAPAGLHLFVLAGVPPEHAETTIEELLDDEWLQYELDTETGQPEISCRSESLGRAFPPRRLLQFGAAIESIRAGTVHVGSACTDDALDASFERLDQFVATIAGVP